MAKINLNLVVSSTYEATLTCPDTGHVWVIDGVQDHGYFDYGGMWVVPPTGSTLTVNRADITPGASGTYTNGLMKNPQDQPWSFDSRINNFSSAGNITTSTTVSENDCLVLGEGRDESEALFAGFSVLHVLASAPPTNAICPPAFGYDGTAARPMPTIDITTEAAAMPSLDYTGFDGAGTAADAAAIARSIEPSPLVTTSLENSRRGHASETSGYGRNLAGYVARLMHWLCSDSATAAQKRDILGGLMTNACMWHYGMSQGLYYVADGGWTQGFIGPIKLFLGLTGQSLSTAYGPSNVGANELEQPIIIDAAFLSKLDPHDGAEGYPEISRRRTISAISGNDVTVGGTGLKGSSTQMAGCKLVRESDGAEANILSASQPGGDNTAMTLTLDSNPFSVSDVVSARDRQGFVAGDVTWGIRGQNQREGLQRYSPSPSSSYMELQRWDNVMYLCAIGTEYVDEELRPVLRWIQESTAPNIPTSGTDNAYQDYPRAVGWTYPWGFPGFDFWTAYGQTAVQAALDALDA